MKKLHGEWKTLMKEKDNRVVVRIGLFMLLFLVIYLAAIVYTCYVYLKGGPVVHLPKSNEALQMIIASAIAYRLHQKKVRPFKRLLFRH